MQILVLNGSPKGDYSITLQTALYLEKHHPEHQFEYLNVAARLRSLEKDFSPALEAFARAEAILFVYPVYTFLVPSQLHRFLELMKASGFIFKGKWAGQITTSKHFYDVTAHRFIEENCGDLGLSYVKGLSADMDDLLSEQGRKDALAFFDYFLYCVENRIAEPLRGPFSAPKKRRIGFADEVNKKDGDVVIVTDLKENDLQLSAMIRRFQARLPMKTRVVNIRDFAFSGGCVSCFACAAGGSCIHKDGFSELLRDDIQTADAIVIAFTVTDHSMGSRFKTYDDRQFVNGHRTVTAGMPFGYLVSGNLSEEDNLRMVIEARAEAGGNFLAGVATDEFDPNREIDDLVLKLSYAVETKLTQPANFFGVGGMKIFRDLIWLMQGFMKADHRFYKARGLYDFPQKKAGTFLKMKLVGGLVSNPKLKAKMGNKMNEGTIAPYKKALEK